MSYELYFNRPEISREQFVSYFEHRPKYELVADQGQAWYENEETGVYFSFWFNDVPEDERDEEEVDHAVMFSMNFFRPHFFALEAELEVARFIEFFGASIHDPQTHGMGDGPYSAAGFIAGWNHGNEFAYSVILKKKKSARQLEGRPGKELENVWRWNHRRKERQRDLPEGVYIPKLIYVRVEEVLYLTCIWSDAMPVLLPMVEKVILHRKAMAPSSFLKGRKEDSCFLPWEDVLPEVQAHRVQGYEFSTYQLPAGEPPLERMRFFRRHKKTWDVLDGLPPDKVLNRELLEQARREA